MKNLEIIYPYSDMSSLMCLVSVKSSHFFHTAVWK